MAKEIMFFFCIIVEQQQNISRKRIIETNSLTMSLKKKNKTHNTKNGNKTEYKREQEF